MPGKMKALQLDIYHHDCVGSLLTERFPEVSMKLSSSVQLIRQAGKFWGYQIVVKITAPTKKELDVYIKALKEFPTVKEVELWAKKANMAYALLRVKSQTSSYEEVVKKGAMHFAPILMERGYDIHSIVTTDFSKLNSLLNDLEEIGEIKVTKIGNIAPNFSSGLLTEKQVDALRKAITFDYYSWPRNVTLADLAKHCKMSHRAYQEHLRKAESKLLPELVKDYLLTSRAG